MVQLFSQVPHETAPSAELKPASGRENSGWEQAGLTDTEGKISISVQDFAVAMIDELEKPAHVRQRFTAGY